MDAWTLYGILTVYAVTVHPHPCCSGSRFRLYTKAFSVCRGSTGCLQVVIKMIASKVVSICRFFQVTRSQCEVWSASCSNPPFWETPRFLTWSQRGLPKTRLRRPAQRTIDLEMCNLQRMSGSRGAPQGARVYQIGGQHFRSAVRYESQELLDSQPFGSSLDLCPKY